MSIIDIDKEGWISTKNRVPEPRIRVEVCCIPEDMSKFIWKSIGRISPSNIWTISASESATMRKVFDNKLTHWRPRQDD